MTESRLTSSWVGFEVVQPSAEYNLLCLPHAGAGGSTFASWGAHLPSVLSLYPVLLPGREARVDEPIPGSFQELARDFVSDNTALLCEPGLVLFGQCTGAWLAYEIALCADRELGIQPELLVIVGAIPPDCSAPTVISDDATLADICDAFVNLGVLDPRVANSDALRDFFVPVIQADYRMQQNYRYVPAAPLTCPIIAARGENDDQVFADQIEGWRRFTRHSLIRFEFEGGHFLETNDSAALLDLVAEVLRRDTYEFHCP